MPNKLATLLAVFLGLVCARFVIHAIAVGQFQHRSGTVIRRTVRPVRYWTTIVVMTAVSVGLIVVAIFGN